MRSTLLRRAALEARGAAVGALLGFIAFGCAMPGPAPRSGINRGAIIAYSDKYWSRYNTAFRNYAPNDCANFVSQSWYARAEDGQLDPKTGFVRSESGIPPDPWSRDQWIPDARSWTLVQGFVDYQNGPGIGHLVNIRMNNPGVEPNGGTWSKLLTNTTPAVSGDAVAYRVGTAGTSTYWSHAALIVDTKYVGTHTDSNTGVRITYDSNVDLINSHTVNRHREPWNTGFRASQLIYDGETLLKHKHNWDAQIVALP